MLIAAGTQVFGQDNRDEIIPKLIARVEALEREVAALKQAGPSTSDSAKPLPFEMAPRNEATAAAQPVEQEPPEEPRFSFHGYADTSFVRNVDGDSSKRFALGEVDLFATARLSPRLNVLMETVLETDDQLEVGNVPVNVERLLLQYRHNDYFNLDIGSYLTAISFYSTAYLRGSWLQTALTRPRLLTFEDEGGFLPLHNVGLSANGQLPVPDLGLHYVVEVGSSRNYAQPGRTGFNLEDNRAINVALFARPGRIPGLQIGFSSYHDMLSPSQGSMFNRSVWSAHAVYQAHRLEFLNEAVLTRFTNSKDGRLSIRGFYSQLAYRVGSGWTPYLRFDYANAYSTSNGIGSVALYVPWRNVTTGGLRYDLSESVALKFEVAHETDRFQPAWIQAAMQLAFTF
jgi:hypothetical protein